MSTATRAEPPLERRIGLGDAVLIGLGSMIGAGVFSVLAPAARVAGTGLLLGLLVAAVVAFCNATSSAQLAAAYPSSGGTYLYGRERLGERWGFVAGWGFVIGKTASCAAMALTFAAYVVPDQAWLQRVVGVAAVTVLGAVNYRGITRTARLTRMLVVAVLGALTILVVGVLASGSPDLERLGGWSALGSPGPYAVLQSAGLIFFAFAGYARIATLGEEVREPRRTIPRAIVAALALAGGVYLVVAVVALATTGPDRLGSASDPLSEVVRAAGVGGLAPVVRVGAALASLGALLALIAGIGRTSLAMARHGDLPSWLSAVHPRTRVPHHAEVAMCAVVAVLVLSVDLRGVIAFSSLGVLSYYAIANASAFTQTGPDRRWPRALNVLGLVGCLVLVFTLPWPAVLVGVVVLAFGLAGREVVVRRRAA